MIVATAITFFDDDARLDLATNAAYIERLRALDVPVLVLGHTGEGPLLSDAERHTLLEMYAGMQFPELTTMLVPSAPSELVHAAEGIGQLIHPPWPAHHIGELASFHRATKRHWMLYSHPERGPLVLTPEVGRELVARGGVPSGAKVSKSSLETIGALRSIFGAGFRLWDGTDRRVSASIAAGADAVVSQTVGALMHEERPGITDQERLDAVRPSGTDKLHHLKMAACAALGRGTPVRRS